MKVIFGLVLLLSIVLVHGELGMLLSVSQIMKPSDCKTIYKVFEIHFTARKRSCGKVLFFAPVILFTGERGVRVGGMRGRGMGV